METLTRRSLLTGIGAVICAPAIVRATSLMPVKAYVSLYEHHTYALAFPITNDEIASRYAAALMRSLQETKTRIVADVLQRYYRPDFEALLSA